MDFANNFITTDGSNIYIYFFLAPKLKPPAFFFALRSLISLKACALAAARTSGFS